MALELLIPIALLFSLPQPAMDHDGCRAGGVESEQYVSLLRPVGLTSRNAEDIQPGVDMAGPEVDQLTVPTPINRWVLEFLRAFQLKGQSQYARWYARLTHYEGIMAPILAEYDVPREVLYLCMVESGFDPDAVSRASAVGQWQFIESTGKAYGLRRDDWVDEEEIRSKRRAQQRDTLRISTMPSATGILRLPHIMQAWVVFGRPCVEPIAMITGVWLSFESYP